MKAPRALISTRYWAVLSLLLAGLAQAQLAPEERCKGSPSAQEPCADGAGAPGLSVLPAGEATPQRVQPGLFLGEDFRYSNRALLLRALADLVAIPAGVGRWEAQDWATFAAVMLPVGTLMLPLDNPLDARLQRSLREELGRHRFRVWTPVSDVLILGSMWGAVAGTLAWGLLADNPRAVEMVSLTLEAFAVTQAYHLTFKMLLGREGPEHGEGNGRLLGPGHSLRLFPAGTPSGHTASIYAMVAVIGSYWDSLPLTVALHTLGLAFATTLVTDDYHFLSDVIWGGAMGYAIGRWVVRHRAVGAASPLQGLTVMPLLTPNGAGLAAGFRF